MEQLESKFAERIQDSIRQSRALGYPPTRFENMLLKMGALRLAKKLVISGDIQTGLKEVAKLGRKDLAMESIMLEPIFEKLFTVEELEAARWRLQQI